MSTIMLIDDNDTNASFMQAILISHKHTVIRFTNGISCLENAQLHNINLILSRVLLPVVDGFALCIKVKKDPSLRHIPVVLFSAIYKDSEDEKLAFDAGADGFLHIPCTPDQLIGTIHSAIQHHSIRLPKTNRYSSDLRQYNKILIDRIEKRIINLEQLVQTQSNLNSDAHAKLEYYMALNNLSHQLREHIDVDKIIKTAISGIANYIIPDVTLLFLRKGSKLELKGCISKTPKYQHSSAPIHYVGECLCGIAARTKTPLFSINIYTDPRCTWEECKKAGLLSFAAVPLVFNDNVIGILGIGSGEIERDFSQYSEMLTTVALEIATSLHNAVEYEKKGHHCNNLKSLNESLRKEIEKRKKIEEERKQLITTLEYKNKDLERFIYSISHDLKSPLVTIEGFLGHFIKTNNDSQNDSITLVKRSYNAAEKLRELLDNILDMIKLGYSLNIQKTPFSFADIVGDALCLLAKQISDRKIRIGCAKNLPMVTGDSKMLLEVMVNLIDNAVKFIGDTPDPYITIGYYKKSDTYVFSVMDNGIGMQPEYTKKIFELFEKLDASSDGTGIGLAISKRIIELHGGEIWAESQGEGKGTTFYFVLPTPKAVRNMKKQVSKAIN
ncbi:MAG: ATP-binding protein [Candidatus Auribacterota bacterium]